jgi:hypothetical protein
MPCPRTGGRGKGKDYKVPSKKFAGPSEGAAEGRVWGGIPPRPSGFLKISVRIFLEISSDSVQNTEHNQFFVILKNLFRLAASRLRPAEGGIRANFRVANFCPTDKNF